VDCFTDGAVEEDGSCRGSKPDITELNDAEVVRRAREEGRVDVVLPGTVSQEGCCRFVSEILKCILYQRQQLPMTYDQLVYSQKKEHGSIRVSLLQRAHWPPSLFDTSMGNA